MKTNKSSLWTDIRRNKFIYLLMFPGILFFIVFHYLPMLGLVVAFQDYNPMKGFASDFVGLRNFRFFFASQDWIRVTWNTVYLNTLFIIAGIVFPITFAIMLSEIKNKYFTKITQSLIVLPHFISWAVVSMFIIAIFSADGGIWNTFLESRGMEPMNINTNAAIWPPLLVLMRIWKEAGFSSIIYIATITSIDTELFEAATIDGASRLQCIFYITIPLLKSTVIVLTLLAVGKIFYGDFGMIYALVGDNSLLYASTDIIDTFSFRALRVNNNFGMSAAIGLFQSTVGLIFVAFSNKLAKKINPDAALF